MTCPDTDDTPTVSTIDPIPYLQAQLAGGDGLTWVWRDTRQCVEVDVRADGTVDVRAEAVTVESVAAFLRALTAPTG